MLLTDLRRVSMPPGFHDKKKRLMSVWYKWLLLAAAGGCGALARYGLAGLVQRLASVGVPVGTLVVNVVGCLGAGFAWAWMEQVGVLSSEWRAIVLIGFFGAFTTFSTYALETVMLMRGGQWLNAGGNLLLHNLMGIAALLLGILMARSLA